MGINKKSSKKTQPKRNETYISFCPKCKSTDVELTISILGGTERHICKQCGYTSNVFPEIPVSKLDNLGQVKAEPSRLQNKRVSRHNTRAGIIAARIMGILLLAAAGYLIYLGVSDKNSAALLWGAVFVILGIIPLLTKRNR